MLGEDLSFREKVVAMNTMLSLIDLNVIIPPPYKKNQKNSTIFFGNLKPFFTLNTKFS